MIRIENTINVVKQIEVKLTELKGKFSDLLEIIETDFDQSKFDEAIQKVINYYDNEYEELNYSIISNDIYNNINFSILEGEIFQNNYFGKFELIKSNIENITNIFFELTPITFEFNVENEVDEDIKKEVKKIDNYTTPIYENFNIYILNEFNDIKRIIKIFTDLIENKINLLPASHLENKTIYEKNDNNNLILLKNNLMLAYFDINLGYNEYIVNNLLEIYHYIENEINENNKLNQEKVNHNVLLKMKIKNLFLLKKIHIRNQKIGGLDENIKYKIVKGIRIENIKSIFDEEKTIDFIELEFTSELKSLLNYSLMHYDIIESNIKPVDKFTKYKELHRNVKYYKDIFKQNEEEYLVKISKEYNSEHAKLKNLNDYNENTYLINKGYILNNLFSIKLNKFNYRLEIQEKVKFISNNFELIKNFSVDNNIYNFFPYFKLYEFSINILNNILENETELKYSKSVIDILDEIEIQFFKSYNWCVERNFIHFINGRMNSKYDDIYIYSSFVVPTSYDEILTIFKILIGKKKNFYMTYLSRIESQKEIDKQNKVVGKLDITIQKLEKESEDNKKQTIEIVTIFTALVAIVTGFINANPEKGGLALRDFFIFSFILLLFVFSILKLVNRSNNNKKDFYYKNWDIFFDVSLLSILIVLLYELF